MAGQSEGKLTKTEQTEAEQGPLLYASFSQQQPANDASAAKQLGRIVSAIHSLITDPASDGSWKSLSKLLSSTSQSLFGVLPLSLQEQFIRVLEENQQHLSEKLCFSILNSSIFDSNFHIRLLSLISSLQHLDLIEKHLQQVSVVSDEAFVAYLRLLSSIENPSHRTACLTELLSKSYSPSSVAALSRDELPVEVVLDILSLLLDIYKENTQLADNALLLISTLIDAHCNHFMWNQDAEGRFRETARLFNELSFLSESILKFEAKRNSQKSARGNSSFYSVKTISLNGRKINW